MFVAFTGLSLLWTLSFDYTYPRTLTYFQLLASLWIIQEFARTKEQQRSVLLAFCLGAFVPLIEVVNNFRLGISTESTGRYSAAGLNANDLGLTLAVGIPIAWQLIQGSRRFARIAAMTYLVLAPIGIVLTGTRGAVLTGLVALSIIPLSISYRSQRLALRAVVVVMLISVPAIVFVPSGTWDRVATIGTELRGEGTMSGRLGIWRAGLQMFPMRPLLGAGAGTFAPAVADQYGGAVSSHNVPIAILIENGIVGSVIFIALLVSCARTIWRLQPADRRLWAVIGASWLVGVMSLNWEFRKVTWLFFGLLAAQSLSVVRHAAPVAHARPTQLEPGGFPAVALRKGR
jgi:O-antigen ligase